MKLSIWQQFSSNHSAFFTVMGKFKTPYEAQQAAIVIREILVKIAHHYEPYDPDQWEANLDSAEKLEAELEQQYGFSTPLNFIQFAQNSQIVGQVVKVFDRTVFIAEEFIDEYTMSSHYPFADFLEKSGADVAYSSELYSTRIFITVSGTAPDKTTADQLMQAVTVSSDEEETYLQLEGVLDDKFRPERQGKIERDGLKITFAGLYSYFDCGQVLITLVEHLKSLGFTDIEYSFRTS